MQELQSASNILVSPSDPNRGDVMSQGPLSQMKIQQPNLNQISQNQGSYKTPSLAFLENKRKEEEKNQQMKQD
jgi:hypothetical protein